MALKDKINEELKSAMKSGDKLRLETIRSVRALILEFEKSGIDRELNPEDEIKMLNTAVKKRREASEIFRAAGKTEMADKEDAEMKILMEFLPKQFTEQEIFDEVAKIASELQATGKEHFPVLMPAVMKSLKGKADGKIVRAAVEKALGMI